MANWRQAGEYHSWAERCSGCRGVTTRKQGTGDHRENTRVRITTKLACSKSGYYWTIRHQWRTEPRLHPENSEGGLTTDGSQLRVQVGEMS